MLFSSQTSGTQRKAKLQEGCFKNSTWKYLSLVHCGVGEMVGGFLVSAPSSRSSPQSTVMFLLHNAQWIFFSFFPAMSNCSPGIKEKEFPWLKPSCGDQNDPPPRLLLNDFQNDSHTPTKWAVVNQFKKVWTDFLLETDQTKEQCHWVLFLSWTGGADPK